MTPHADIEFGNDIFLFRFQLGVPALQRGHIFLESHFHRLEQLHFHLEHLEAFRLALHLVLARVSFFLRFAVEDEWIISMKSNQIELTVMSLSFDSISLTEDSRRSKAAFTLQVSSRFSPSRTAFLWLLAAISSLRR